MDKCRGHGSRLVEANKGESWKELIGFLSARSGVVASAMFGRDRRSVMLLSQANTERGI